jgi:hypothetical protein
MAALRDEIRESVYKVLVGFVVMALALLLCLCILLTLLGQADFFGGSDIQALAAQCQEGTEDCYPLQLENRTGGDIVIKLDSDVTGDNIFYQQNWDIALGTTTIFVHSGSYKVNVECKGLIDSLANDEGRVTVPRDTPFEVLGQC